ncbi:unnamed protein product [Sordaria macrospora k-hell]|uniref:WGS project CABT00000000 data, contig 2.4 n=1 Tax=Sordaria macrospora (strain ATCC MYA-333 / DSM 997 / K(L3346) / K-hell) TaxID=771870 RepID=F7VQA0_SORMK|nr:uncharacterized protein SMAC_01249 [Sordaria macrospora k-hell]CCC07682.1 unnamed protein product [Sordaria macrospora k-hell]
MDQQQQQKDKAPLRPRVANACEACRTVTNPSSLQKQSPLPGLPPGPSRTFTIDVPIPTSSVDVAISLESLRLDHEGFMDHICPNTGVDSEDEDGTYGYDHEYDDDGNCEGDGSVISSHASSLPVGASAATPGSSSASASASGVAQFGAGFGGGGTGPRIGNRNGDRNGKPGPGPGGSSRSLASLSVQPQFNVDSASQLLNTFQKVMVWHFPCVLVDHVSVCNDDENEVKLEEATVASLARERPFVLLAVLAAASSTRTLQGHSLYDEEFRKILGLKFVAGGERSLELLQGLAAYVAWYPFHLRPKNRQAFQYVRMAVDMVNDLELDVDPGFDELNGPRRPSPQRLEEIRTYLATYYVASNFATSWNRTPSMSFTNYTSKCCDILEKYSITKGDCILPWLVRLQRLCEETNDLRKPQRGGISGLPQQTESQIEMIIKGMEAQLNEWEAKMPSELKSIPSIRITTLFTRLFLTGAPLLKLPSVKLPGLEKGPPPSFRVDPNRLLSLIPTLHQNYEYFLSLSAHEINAFSMIGWGCLILSTILGFRMSFPITFCPGWDDYGARRVVRFDKFLERLCRLGTGTASSASSEGGSVDKDRENVTPATMSTTKGMDVLSASKVVFAVVRRKFRNRVAKLEGTASLGKERDKDARMGGVGVGVGICPVTGKAVGEDESNAHGYAQSILAHGEEQHFQSQQPLRRHHQHQHQHQHQHLNIPIPPTDLDFVNKNIHHHHQHPQAQQEVLDIHMDLSMLPLDIDIPQSQSQATPIPIPTLHIPSTNVSGCPMMDGSLEPYYPYWDETFALNTGGSPNSLGSLGSGSSSAATTANTTRNDGMEFGGSGNGGGGGQHGHVSGDGNSVPSGPGGMPMMMGSGMGGINMNMVMSMGMGYNDLWAAMTMDWAGGGEGVENWA